MDFPGYFYACIKKTPPSGKGGSIGWGYRLANGLICLKPGSAGAYRKPRWPLAGSVSRAAWASATVMPNALATPSP